MSSEFEILAVMVPKKDKEAIKEIAIRNGLTMSDIARMLITHSLGHMGESDALRLVV